MNIYNLDPFDNTMYPTVGEVPSNGPSMGEPTRHSFTGPNFLDKVFFELPPEMNSKAHQPRSRAATWDSTSFSIPPPPNSGGGISNNNGGGIQNDCQQQQQSHYARDRSYSVKSDPIGTQISDRGTTYPPRDASSSSSTVASAAQSRPLIQVPPTSNKRIPLNMSSVHLPLSRKFRLTKERSEPRMMTTSTTMMLGTESGTAGGGATAPGSSVSKMMVDCPRTIAKKPMSLADAGKTVGTAPVAFGNISKIGNTMTNKLYKVTERRGVNQRRKMEQENFQQAANQALVHEGSFA